MKWTDDFDLNMCWNYEEKQNWQSKKQNDMEESKTWQLFHIHLLHEMIFNI